MTDTIIFGNSQSEKQHEITGDFTSVQGGGIKLLPTNPPSRFTSEVTFKIKVDPYKQNYFSLKLHSSDKYTPIFLYIDGKQLGYAKCGDFEALNLCYGSFNPANYFYVTTAIPIWCTKNKHEITLSLRQGEPYDDIYEVNGKIFEAYSTLCPSFDLPENKTGVTIKKSEDFSINDAKAFSDKYIAKQVEYFNNSLEKLRRGEKLSITKYVEEFRHFCMMLFEPYCPLEDKSEACDLILNCINLYVKDYFENPQSLLRTSHQSDWGGYYGELGQGLYIIEKLLDKDKFQEYLASPFDGKRTKKEAWELCLKANFDFASARQSYIFNQTYYTYEGAWKSMAGLGVIGSKYYIGKEKCDRILKEALGIAPWLGEHILFDSSGRELDLYHCLFHHDQSAVFTDDFKNIVCTGQAVQGKDEKGDFLRRKPYGENYYPLTHMYMPRENGYVANYGETLNYMPEWVYRTFNHGDWELSDEILKMALENINGRLFMRYSGTDENNNPIMLMEQAIDERNPTMNSKPAYGAIVHDKRTMLFASLKRHMDEHSERYKSRDWDKYKLYAKKALDAFRQQNLDGNLKGVLDELVPNYNDFRIDRTILDICKDDITYLLPHTDLSINKYNVNLPVEEHFVFFDIDNLNLSLRDKDTHIFAQLNHRSRGFSGYGRAHIIKNGTHHLTQFKTDGAFTKGGEFIRQQNVNMDFIYDSSGSNSYCRGPEPLLEFGSTPQALCGEEQSITYQKGIGTVLRENYEVDTPYSGYPDVIWTKIDKYFIACNTTRESYQNAKAYTLPFEINGEKITLEPFSYRVIKTDDEILTPSSVTYFRAITHQNGTLLSWKASSGESYNIYRDGILIKNTKDTVYEDASVKEGLEYTYFVTSVNKYGESIPSPVCTVKAEKCGGFMAVKIGSPDTKGVYFGEGNDYHARERNILDSLYFYAKAVHGDMSATSNSSVMARENLCENARYAYIGFEGDKIVIRTRSKNTIYTFSQEKLSPLCFTLPKGNFVKLKLLVDKDLHSVAFFASEGKDWTLLRREILPFPQSYYLGSTENENAVLQKETLLKPFPIKDWEIKDNILYIQKRIDNKYILVESSNDGEIFTLETDNLVSQKYNITNLKPYYRITPINRHGERGESITIKSIQN
ncbi:MAG: hypothetical protein ACI3XA_01550 [Clostridia bacterium]